MNEAIKAGEVFELAGLVPYADGKIVNMDVAHNGKMKFVVMAFDEGTALSEHAAPGERADHPLLAPVLAGMGLGVGGNARRPPPACIRFGGNRLGSWQERAATTPCPLLKEGVLGAAAVRSPSFRRGLGRGSSSTPSTIRLSTRQVPAFVSLHALTTASSRPWRARSTRASWVYSGTLSAWTMACPSSSGS